MASGEKKRIGGKVVYVRKANKGATSAAGGGAKPKGEPFVSVKRSGGRGDTVLVTLNDGEYRYQSYIPTYDKKIDTSDPEYKRALRGNNIKVKFTANGEAVVTKGGLFSKGRTFKTIDAFQQEANRRLDAQAERGKSEFSRIQSGRMTQIEAENLKSYAKEHVIGDTKGHYEKQAVSAMKAARIQQEAALDMKRRLATVVDSAKKKVKQ